jgi:hypothetical protein
MTLRHDDLDPSVGPGEREHLARIATQLEYERPVPRAGFRGVLQRRLHQGRVLRSRDGITATRRIAYGWLVAGAAMLMLAAAGLADVGPMAPASSSVVGWIIDAV